MDTKTILIHDPYDVFLAVGFGFCYASAILPGIRTLERYKKNGKLVAESVPSMQPRQDWGTRFIRMTVLCRGFLTIIGLACLYGWYSYYLKTFYHDELPAYRIALDWCSLGLFAIGANWWDNEDHHEDLYCLIQGLASFIFGVTCYLAMPPQPDERSIPLLKAIFWCVIITSAGFFYLATTRISGNIFKSTRSEREKYLFVSIMFLIALVLVVSVDWAVFWSINLVNSLQKHLGWGVYAFAVGIFAVIIFMVIMIEKKAVQSRFKSILVTILPMGLLIWVTYKNYKTLFPQG
jgi:hypothetical protein